MINLVFLREFIDFYKVNVVKDSEVQEVVLSREMKVKEEFFVVLEKV